MGLRPRRAFTLAELLVVIGIITLLIAMLLSSLGKARESANRIYCMSNLRQLVVAFQLYTQDNDGWYPNAANSIRSPSDWIFWEPDRDPNQSAIVPYIGGTFNPRNFVCPSDDVSTHSGSVPYRFSYTMNARIAGAHATTTTYYPEFPPVKQNHVRRPSQKILLIDEASTGIDDGAWAVYSMTVADGGTHNILSNRHDRAAEKIDDVHAGKGNVAFADGHCDYVDRAWCLMPQYVDPLAQ